MPAGKKANIARHLLLKFGTNFVKVPALPLHLAPVFIVESVFMKPIIETLFTRIMVSF
jgi:hypothetical protein